MNPSEYNFCPRCAGRFDEKVIKDGEPERLVCTSCGFVFYQGPKLVAGALFEMDGSIVLTQRAIEPGYGLWTYPGGFVERGEKVEDAAAREAFEETGVRVEVTGFVGLYSYEGYVPVIASYSARVVGGELAPLDETMDVRAFPKDEIPWADIAFPSTRDALMDYLRRGSFGA